MRRFPFRPLSKQQIICGIVDGVDSGVRCDRPNCQRCNGMRKATVRDGVIRRRPVKTDHYIWCDVHGEVHTAEWDVYHECWDGNQHTPDKSDCKPENWRPVYILGERGEVF